MVHWLDSLIETVERGERVAVAMVVGPADLPPGLAGRRVAVRADGTTVGSGRPGAPEAILEALAREALTGSLAPRLLDRPVDATEAQELGVLPGTALRIFVEMVAPADTLLIVGAGHIALPLCRIGKILGFSVTVLDDRPEFASRERFPEADRVISGDYASELARFPITPSTHVVLVTRGHVQDEEALRAVVASSAAYLGMIGSRRRVGAVLDRLRAEGVPPGSLDRVWAPIGLDISAETPEEIAVSILAEVIHARRRGELHASSLSRRRGADVRP